MVDGLLMWFHFTIFCSCCYLAFRRYAIFAEHDIDAEKERKNYLIISRNNVQDDVEQAEQEMVEQEVLCQVMYSKVEHWRESFMQEQLHHKEEIEKLQKAIYKRHQEMVYEREIYSLNKELLPQVIDQVREELKKRYASTESRQQYNHKIVYHLSKASNIL